MSTVYKLPYTGNEIKEKIGQVDKNTTDIGQLSEQIDDLENGNIPLDFNVIEDKYIYISSGLEMESSGYICTDFIPIGLYDIWVKTHVNEDVSAMYFYNNKKEPIAYTGKNMSANNDEFVKLNPPKIAKYFRTSCLKAHRDVLEIKTNDSFKKLSDEMVNESDLIMKAVFSKILCIGDSLTQGAYYLDGWTGNSIRKNYPNMLGRMCNTPVDNAGYSGITAKGWYNNYKLTDYSDYDLFILWLGTNEGLTDTLERDVNSHSVYTEYADTNTGCYCKIIEDIYKTCPRATIIMVNVFDTNGELETTQKVISEIATKYNLPLIDMTDFNVVNNRSFHGNIENPHFNVFGNYMIAKHFISEISKILMNNFYIVDRMPDMTMKNWVNTVRPSQN